MIAGRYSLDREIGRGGMGAVWLGRDEVLGRPVAVKRVGLLPGVGDPDLERAEREARIAASVNHPHVVAVFDLVHDDDAQWLVMEYVEGTTLTELINSRGRLTPDESAPLLAQAAEALAAAHAAGIVHRDVKPSNILVDPDGQVKLSDFGIARAEADASLTQTGLVTGSPAYLAPEVAAGQLASAASDVWSLGATLFHTLAGRPPYDVVDNVLGALYRIVHEDPPRLEDAGALAPALSATMLKDPAQRWSMTEFADFLRTLRLPAGRAAPALVAGATLDAAPDRPPGVEATAVMSRVMPPVPVAAGGEPGPAVVVPAAAPATAPSRRRQRSVRPLVGAAVVVVVLLTAAGVLLGLRNAGDRPTGNPRVGSSSPTGSPSEPRVTAAGMQQFVQDYLQTASTDPGQGFQRLTPAFQAQSDQYQQFWSQVSAVKVLDISANPADMTVSYTYSYVFDGEPRTDDVTLTLTFDKATGRYLISGEA